VLNKLKQLASAGVKIIVGKEYIKSFNGNKNIIAAPYTDSSFAKLGVQKDLEVIEMKNNIAWTHRKDGNADIYFISGHNIKAHAISFLFRANGKQPEIWNAVTGQKYDKQDWTTEGKMTSINLVMASNESLFIIFRKQVAANHEPGYDKITKVVSRQISNKWTVKFDSRYGGPKSPIVFDNLLNWSQDSDTAIKYYSGTAIYSNVFTIDKDEKEKEIWIYFDSIYNIASVKINGIYLGTLWTKPYSLDITKAVKEGENTIEIEVTNTWHNRLIGDNLLPLVKG
jgi:hypothetical protein